MNYKWSEAEDELMRQHYKTIGATQMVQLLVDNCFAARTKRSVEVHANGLKITQQNLWTKKEIKILQSNYHHGSKCVQEMLKSRGFHRSTVAIKSKAVNLFLSEPKFWWTTKEERIVKQHQSLPSHKIGEILGRTASSVRMKMRLMNIKPRYRRWTAAEIKIVCDNLDKDYKTLSRLLNENGFERNPRAVLNVISKQKLRNNRNTHD